MLYESIPEVARTILRPDEILALMNEEAGKGGTHFLPAIEDIELAKAALAPYRSFSQGLHEFIVKTLEARGQVIGKKHSDSLRKIATAIAESVIDDKKQLIEISLETGLGKSTGILCTLLKIQQDGIGKSCLVSVPNLRAMAEYVEQLRLLGYDMKEVGAVYGADSGTAAEREIIGPSTPEKEIATKSVLLLCHQRTRTRSDWDTYLYSDQGKRIAFYDESLKFGVAATFSVSDLRGARSNLSIGDKLVEMWLDDSLTALEEVAKRGEKVAHIEVAPPNAYSQIEWAAKQHNKGKAASRINPAPFKHLVNGVNFRSESFGQFSIDYQLPNDFDSLFVFDANHRHSPISSLSGVDSLFLDQVKRCDFVEVICGEGSLGREGFLYNLEWEMEQLKKMVGGLPEDYVFFHFADRPDDLAEDDKGNGKKSISQWVKDIGFHNPVTWGMEAGFNALRTAKVVVCAGVLRVSDNDTAAQMALAQNDLAGDITTPRLASGTEQMLRLYQAVSRGNMRNVWVDEKGRTQARPMTIYLNGAPTKEQRKFLIDLMPGIKITEERLDDDYKLLLKALDGETRISSKKLKDRPELAHLKSDRKDKKGERRWDALIVQLEANTSWRRDGKSLVLRE